MDSTVGPLTAAEAERLAIIVMSRGQAWLGARGTVNHELAHEIAERLFDGVEQEFEGNRKQEQAANDDRINLQLSAIGRPNAPRQGEFYGTRNEVSRAS